MHNPQPSLKSLENAKRVLKIAQNFVMAGFMGTVLLGAMLIAPSNPTLFFNLFLIAASALLAFQVAATLTEMVYKSKKSALDAPKSPSTSPQPGQTFKKVMATLGKGMGITAMIGMAAALTLSGLAIGGVSILGSTINIALGNYVVFGLFALASTVMMAGHIGKAVLKGQNSQAQHKPQPQAGKKSYKGLVKMAFFMTLTVLTGLNTFMGMSMPVSIALIALVCAYAVFKLVSSVVTMAQPKTNKLETMPKITNAPPPQNAQQLTHPETLMPFNDLSEVKDALKAMQSMPKDEQAPLLQSMASRLQQSTLNKDEIINALEGDAISQQFKQLIAAPTPSEPVSEHTHAMHPKP